MTDLDISTQVAVLASTVANIKTLVEEQKKDSTAQFIELKSIMTKMADGFATKDSLVATQKQIEVEITALAARVTVLENNQTWGTRNLILTLSSILVSIGLSIAAIIIANNK